MTGEQDEASWGSSSLYAKAAIGLMVDLLHWLSAHGCDQDSALDLAQERFEAEEREAL
ncbi:hypothetical protein NKH18_18680 [Streptomyces sp. M10(2022)]